MEQARGERDRAAVSIDQARSGMVELETEIENARANYRLRAMDELNTVVAEQSELAESFTSAGTTCQPYCDPRADGRDRQSAELPDAGRLCEHG